MTGEPDDLVRADPGLGRLVGALTSTGTPDELAGEQAALAMFRQERAAATGSATLRMERAASPAYASGASGASGVPGASRLPRRAASSSAGRRRVGASRRRAGAGRWLAVAATFSLMGGFAAAGFAAVLPAPLQHVAYRVLGFAGVPDSHGVSPAGGPHPSASRGRGSATPGGGHGTPPAPSPVSPSGPAASGSPAPGEGPTLTVRIGRERIVAGGRVIVAALLTERGGAVAGARVLLMERAAGEPGWHEVGAATTGRGGRAILVAGRVVVNATFLVTGPGGAASRPMNVVVAPPVVVRLGGSPERRARVLLVSCPLARPGDVAELEALSAGGRWRVVRARRMGRDGNAAFAVAARKVAMTYRVVLLATTEHGSSASSPVTVAPRHRLTARR